MTESAEQIYETYKPVMGIVGIDCVVVSSNRKKVPNVILSFDNPEHAGWLRVDKTRSHVTVPFARDHLFMSCWRWLEDRGYEVEISSPFKDIDIYGPNDFHFHLSAGSKDEVIVAAVLHVKGGMEQ